MSEMKLIRHAGKLWYEGNDLYIRTPTYSGLYYLQIDKETFLDFLADAYHDDNEDGRVYKFVGIRNITQPDKNKSR